VHIDGLETTLMEVEQLPTETDTIIVGRHPRRRDGKDVDYIQQNVGTVIFPLHRILFIEIMTDEREEEFETFIRE
jgi:hypothetical protein